MRKLPIALAAAAAILSTAAVAQTKPATAPAMTPKTTGSSAKSATSPAMTRKISGPMTRSTSMMTKSTPAMSKTPAMAPMPSMAKGTTGGRMVTTKTSTGKTVTYNCSLAGNATKKACK